jgi:hypothetical protein
VTILFHLLYSSDLDPRLGLIHCRQRIVHMSHGHSCERNKDNSSASSKYRLRHCNSGAVPQLGDP